MVTNTTIYTRQLYVSLSSDTPDVDFHNGDEVYLIDTRKRFIYDEENSTWYPLPTGGSAPVLTTKTITENGTYAAEDDNADGYSSVTVDVQGSGGDPYELARKIADGSITEYVDNQITTLKNFAFSGCRNLTVFRCPNVTTINIEALSGVSVPALAFPKPVSLASTGHFVGNAALTAVDLNVSSISGACFANCTSLGTLVLRRGSVTVLANMNAINGTPFASGGSGGTLYVPQALIAAYQAATNWSTILGYENNQIKPIEGSIYETQYADGTPVGS